MKRTRNDSELPYLAAIFVASLALASPRLVWFAQGTVLGWLVLPVLPHLPAFFYGAYTQKDEGRGVPGEKENYLLALFVSAPLSYYVALRAEYMARGLPPAYPVWYAEAVIIGVVLLVPTFHSYSEYKKYGDFREVVLLFMVYAPWVQFVRLFVGYVRFV